LEIGQSEKKRTNARLGSKALPVHRTLQSTKSKKVPNQIMGRGEGPGRLKQDCGEKKDWERKRHWEERYLPKEATTLRQDQKIPQLRRV
jgi:hypothetical protein